jgi:long-chain acyl-CoA synthetase
VARIFVHLEVRGLEHLEQLEPPVIFAPNHQSHLDVPSLMAALPAKWRYRATPAMSREFFASGRWSKQLQYYLATLLFNGFTLPQREAGARDALRYAGELAAEGWCIVIFPEGKISTTGEIAPFQAGVGLLASKLGAPVVPVRLSGVDKVLHRSWKMAKPGRVQVRFGPALHLTGDDHQALAAEVERAVRSL